ncbi:hypothetical protein EIP91_010724 [Steccherinum ochraceum]|uniref:Uncharacterized protein n=1 Tax=Steccherinum ochraceum TaxID=92696 RepID=A0A4R0RWQ3_9APHY|nr:hypothetical protein EIP91_010724 [Steccherinum ochraceum]
MLGDLLKVVFTAYLTELLSLGTDGIASNTLRHDHNDHSGEGGNGGLLSFMLSTTFLRTSVLWTRRLTTLTAATRAVSSASKATPAPRREPSQSSDALEYMLEPNAPPKLFTDPARHARAAEKIRSLIAEQRYVEALETFRKTRPHGFNDLEFFEGVFAHVASSINSENFYDTDILRLVYKTRHLLPTYLATVQDGDKSGSSVLSHHLRMLHQANRHKEVFTDFMDLASTSHANMGFYKTMLSILNEERHCSSFCGAATSGRKVGDRVVRVWNTIPSEFVPDAEMIQNTLNMLAGGTLHHRRIGYQLVDKWVHSGKIPVDPSLAFAIGELYKSQFDYERLQLWTKALLLTDSKNVVPDLVKDALYCCALASAWTGTNNSSRAIEILQLAIEKRVPLSGNAFTGALMTTWVGCDWEAAKRVVQLVTGRPFEAYAAESGSANEASSSQSLHAASDETVHPQARYAFAFLAHTAFSSESMQHKIELLRFIASLPDPWEVSRLPDPAGNQIVTGAIIYLAARVRGICKQVLAAGEEEVGAEAIQLASSLKDVSSDAQIQASKLLTKTPYILRELANIHKAVQKGKPSPVPTVKEVDELAHTGEKSSV